MIKQINAGIDPVNSDPYIVISPSTNVADIGISGVPFYISNYVPDGQVYLVNWDTYERLLIRQKHNEFIDKLESLLEKNTENS